MHKKRRSHRYDAHILNIPDKANRILNVILLAMILVVIRIWHLAVVQYEDKVEEARRPRAKVVVEPAKRATIRDRFNIPMAINKVRYQAAIVYSHILEVPSIVWETDPESGKRKKHYKRKEYIAKLSKLLGKELQLDSEKIEDLIYAKAAFLYQIPLIIKEDISEKEYYRLKMMEKDWLGIHVQRVPKRYYPLGRVGADILGYMGAINRQQYDSILQELRALEAYLEEESNEEGEPELPIGIANASQARARLKELQEHAYTINDFVGKTGIEGMFEEDLRGYHGKKVYHSDARGNFLRELPGSKEPISGHRMLLTISSELQEFAEQLLIQNEQIREGRVDFTEYGKHATLSRPPWIKGGAIVVMEPNTGEVLALASHPRFDPNDFIMAGEATEKQQKRSNILQWFENEAYLAEIWDRKRPMTRELYDETKKKFVEQEQYLTWEKYREMILPPESPVDAALDKVKKVREAIALQRDFQTLMDLLGQQNAYLVMNRLYHNDETHIPYQNQLVHDAATLEANFKLHTKTISDVKKKLQPFLADLKHNYDKVLLLDLCRLAADATLFPTHFADDITLSSYREMTASMTAVREAMLKKTKEIFHDVAFKQWRKEHEKEFLKEKRKEEKLAKRYPKPYIDYLDAQENKMFHEFWEKNQWHLLTQDNLQEELKPYYEALASFYDQKISPEYLKTVRSFQQLDFPLLGKYRHLRGQKGVQLGKHLAAAFYPVYGYGHGRSQAYRQAAVQGSIFKLVTTYAALKQQFKERYEKGLDIAKFNPFEFIDDVHRNGKGWNVGYRMDGTPIPQLYKGGRLPRSRIPNMGKMDLMHALEMSSNPYFSLLAGDFLHDPEDLADAAREFSFGARTGIDLPAELAGKVPKDLTENRTGLYSFAIGQHSFVVTPLQTAVMLSTIANGGKVFKPKIISMTSGRERENGKEYIVPKTEFSYRESLAFAGVDFPLFTAAEKREQESLVNRVNTEIKHELLLPDSIRQVLLKAMQRVAKRGHSEGIASLTRLYQKHPETIQSFTELKEELIGKTSTSQALENLNLDLEQGTCMCTHVWFGGVSFDKSKTYVSRDEFGKPELVVVVYLRLGSFGKEAAPLASQIVKKWREIKKSAA